MGRYGKNYQEIQVLTHILLRNLPVVIETDVGVSFSFNSKNTRVFRWILNKAEQRGLEARTFEYRLVEQQVKSGS